jgi:F-type H+-transporting ATPase subunit delta
VMRAASRLALAELRDRVDSVTGRFSTADGLTGLAGELFEVVDLLNDQPQLRRRLADPTADPERRAGLIGALLEGKVSPSAVTIVRDAATLRWSSAWDLVDALEITADDILLGAAEQAGVLDRVEDELFRFERVLDQDSRLTTLLDDYSAPADRRIELLDRLVSGKVHPLTLQLLEHAVASQRRRSVTRAIDDLLDLAARRRQRSMARVISAVELTSAQQQRLAGALSQLYGRPITIRTAVEPSMRGGLVVRVGDEVIDGSVDSRLAEVRTSLTV